VKLDNPSVAVDTRVIIKYSEGLTGATLDSTVFCVSLYMELRPFTEFSANLLGDQLCAIVSKPANHSLLPEEFPSILSFYGTRAEAVRTVVSRQRSMQQEPGYEACAVLMGFTKTTARITGVTTSNQCELPLRNLGYGPNMAIWLDQARETPWRNIGTALMEMRMKRLLANPHFQGRAWTIIRPTNKASLRVWHYGGYHWGGFEPRGEPRNFARVDGIAAERQLFTSFETLERMRG